MKTERVAASPQNGTFADFVENGEHEEKLSFSCTFPPLHFCAMEARQSAMEAGRGPAWALAAFENNPRKAATLHKRAAAIPDSKYKDCRGAGAASS